MKKNYLRLSVFLVVFSLLLTGISAFSSPTQALAATASINKKKANMYIGDTVQLKVKNASGTVKWKSSNKAVAKVGTKGKVTALKPGTATITGTVGGKKYTCKVYVTDTLPLTAEFIPDKAFRDELELYDWDFDGFLSQEEIAEVENLTLNWDPNLKGIEYLFGLKKLVLWGSNIDQIDFSKFKELTVLHIYNNRIENLDVSKNTKLTELECSGNQLTKLDLSKNKALKVLDCSGNMLTELDLSSNTKLERLHCTANALGSIDISGLSNLIQLNVSDNYLENLDVSGLKELVSVSCQDNQISKLTFFDNSKLEQLNCDNNHIGSLTLTAFPLLDRLSCDGNRLTSLDLSANKDLTYLSCNNNELTDLDLSHNTRLNVLKCSGNPMRKPDTDMLSSLNQAEYPDNSQETDIAFPDKNLAEIVKNFDTNYDGRLSEAECDVVRDLDISNSGISDLTGLDAFYNLETLDCSDNTLSVINLNLPKLTKLNLHCSGVKELNVSGLPSLESLDCSCNPISKLDLKANTKLTNLCVAATQITTLDISMLNDLAAFFCGSCAQYYWGHPDLGYYYTPLEVLTTGASEALTEFTCNQTMLSSIDLTGYPNIESLCASNNSQLAKMLLTTTYNLCEIDCQWNDLLSELSIKDAPNLYRVWAYRNALEKLEIVNCPNVTEIRCGMNKLTDFSYTGDSLYELDINTNNITSLNLSSYEQLYDLNVSATLIESLDVSTLNSIRNMDCSSCKNLNNITFGHQAFRTLNVYGCTALRLLDLRNVSLDNQYTLITNNCSSELQIIF